MAVAVLGLAGCASGDGQDLASNPTSTATSVTSSVVGPTSTSSTSTTSTSTTSTSEADDVVEPAGFESVAATATTATGEVCELCLWSAATPADRSRGLMFVTDLGDADGMAFVYPEPTSTSYWMKNTLMPLSIAFFDADGRYLDGFDMEPCTADPCPTYPTPDGFSVAIEVAQGMAEDLGLTPGSTLTLTTLPCQ